MKGRICKNLSTESSPFNEFSLGMHICFLSLARSQSHGQPNLQGKLGNVVFQLGPMQPRVRLELSLVKEGNGCWVASALVQQQVLPMGVRVNLIMRKGGQKGSLQQPREEIIFQGDYLFEHAAENNGASVKIPLLGGLSNDQEKILFNLSEFQNKNSLLFLKASRKNYKLQPHVTRSCLSQGHMRSPPASQMRQDNLAVRTKGWVVTQDLHTPGRAWASSSSSLTHFCGIWNFSIISSPLW